MEVPLKYNHAFNPNKLMSCKCSEKNKGWSFESEPFTKGKQKAYILNLKIAKTSYILFFSKSNTPKNVIK